MFCFFQLGLYSKKGICYDLNRHIKYKKSQCYDWNKMLYEQIYMNKLNIYGLERALSTLLGLHIK